VKANYRGALDEPILSKPFTFVVATPWFMTWWFRLSVVVSSVLSMILLIRLYYSRKTEKQRLILEKERRSKKNEPELLPTCMMILARTLSRIKFISEKIKLKSENESQLNQDLQKSLITAMRWLKR
jgi:accessory gene regulator protein AgrB